MLIGTFFSVLFCLALGNRIKLIILPILSGYLESVLQEPQVHCFSTP